MTIQEFQAKWDSMKPAQRVAEFGASKSSSSKKWNALGVMAQMLVILPVNIIA